MSRLYFLVLLLNFLSPFSHARVGAEEKYFGILLCADCEGISTRLILKEKQQFELSMTYLGKSQNVFTTLGKYQQDKSGRLHLLGTSDTLFTFRKSSHNLILQFREQGQWKDVPVNNSLSMLSQCTPQQEKELSGKWELRKTDQGDLSSLHFEGGPPILHFFPRELRFEGYSGCNEIFGTFRLKENQIIFDKDIAASRMFCENSAEKLFLNFLPQVVLFQRTENQLFLISENGSRFEFELSKEE